MRVDVVDKAFVVEATLIGDLLDLPAADVPALMRSNEITSVCETGIGADQGTFRLNLFHGARHVRLRIDTAGRILHRSIINFGDQSLRRARRTAGKPEATESSNS